MTDDVMRFETPRNYICLQMMINVHNTSWPDYQNLPSAVLRVNGCISAIKCTDTVCRPTRELSK